jgi:hypothetical protein
LKEIINVQNIFHFIREEKESLFSYTSSSIFKMLDYIAEQGEEV